MPSEQQAAIIAHPLDHHGVVLAGPGTGKSTTVLQLAQRLLSEADPPSVRIATFTRAATAELVEKIREEGHEVAEPTTVHSLALSVLMQNEALSQLPSPLRVPSGAEAKRIQKDLARILRSAGFDRVNSRKVAALEREMAARWENLDPDHILFGDLDPALRNAYLSAWAAHRGAFGYSLFAEMALYAHQLLEDHPDAQTGPVDLLVIDEYQDLNRSEIALVQAFAGRGASVLAVGDDDQSIYGWRMAHPAGIREFSTYFAGAISYPLSVSFRCGTQILDVARRLIESAPGRPTKASLSPGPANPSGRFAYLRFPTQDGEVAGVVGLIERMIAEGTTPGGIAVLLRSDFNNGWSGPLHAALEAQGLPYTNVEAALEPLSEPNSQRLMAAARCVENREDDLAWWTLMDLQPGVSDAFVAAVTDQAIADASRFHAALVASFEILPAGASASSQAAAVKAYRMVNEVLDSLTTDPIIMAREGWPDWIETLAERLGFGLSPEFVEALRESEAQEPSEQLAEVLNSLEPRTKDRALRQPAISVMTMATSKGLTFDAAISMGVEQEVLPGNLDPEEQRRLLYVALTRARRYGFMTMAQRRTGQTARTGGGRSVATRSRCSFFQANGVNLVDGPSYLSAWKAEPPATG